jgi:ribosomal protein L17
MVNKPGSDAETLVDYVLGELPPEKTRVLEERLADEGLLRVNLYEHQQVINALRAIEAPRPSIDFTSSVMAQIREERVAPVTPAPTIIPFPQPWRPLVAIAALLLVCVGASVAWLVRQPAIAPTIAAQPMIAPEIMDVAPPVAQVNTPASSDVAWLTTVQLADGSWDSLDGGGTWRAKPGLTALVLCGLMKSEQATIFTGEKAETAQRALTYLVTLARDPKAHHRRTVVQRQQVMFVGVALHEARRLSRDEHIIRQIDEALACLNLPAAEEPLSVANVILPNLPEDASRMGGRIYLVARAMLIDS